MEAEEVELSSLNGVAPDMTFGITASDMGWESSDSGDEAERTQLMDYNDRPQCKDHTSRKTREPAEYLPATDSDDDGESSFLLANLYSAQLCRGKLETANNHV